MGGRLKRRAGRSLVNSERLAAELLRALRGKRSQTASSRRLGFSTNVAHTWESGRRFPATSTFFRVASRLRATSYDAALGAFCGRSDTPSGQELATRAGIARMLRMLRGNLRIRDIAAAVGVNRATVSRWLEGTGEPRLPEFLALIDVCTHRLLELVAIFVAPDTLPSARSAWGDLQAQLRVAYELPWSHAVMRVLETDGYRALGRHRAGFIAQQLGLSRADETAALAALVAAKQIKRTKRGWQVARVMTVDTSRDPARNRALKLHWAAVGAQRLRDDSEGLYSYNLFVVSQADYLRLRALQVDHFEQMRAIIAQSQPGERVVLANIQLIPLDPPAINRK